MKRWRLIALLLGCVLLTPAAWAASPTTPAGATQAGLDQTPVGRWLTPGHDAVIEIAPCGAALCGNIVGISLGPQDPVPKDWAGRSQCDLTIIRTGRTAPDTWTGTVIDPRSGDAYHARITLDAAHRLQLRGYIGLPLFGRTQTWTPYTGPMAANCRLS